MAYDQNINVIKQKCHKKENKKVKLSSQTCLPYSTESLDLEDEILQFPLSA